MLAFLLIATNACPQYPSQHAAQFEYRLGGSLPLYLLDAWPAIRDDEKWKAE
jgi:hypothetical protein